jgi:16S rRNA (guanine(1405)-N(7))-methyltransferase
LEPLEKIVEEIALSAKYRTIAPSVVRRVGAEALRRTHSTKEAIKETKATLHQMAGAYLANRPRYGVWEEALKGAGDSWGQACREMMALHASTQERLPFLEVFYAQIFDLLPPVKSVLDLACGLNPLAKFAMPLQEDATYFAYDLYTDLAWFLQSVGIEAGVCDLLTIADRERLYERPVDVAFLLKIVPLLDHGDRGVARELLLRLPAKHIVVSFPTRSLGGKGKGMVQNYTTRFESLVAGESWSVERLEFQNELCFVVSK